MILICQCDCHPRNPSGIQNGTFRRVLFLFSDRCLLRTLPWKENNGEEHCSCSRFTTIRSKAKQENKIVTCVTLCEPVHGVQWVAVVYVQYMCKASWLESVWVHTIARWWRLVLIDTVSQSSPPSPNITLAPLSYGFHYSGMRVRGPENPALHTCSTEWRHPGLKNFNMAKKHEQGEHS